MWKGQERGQGPYYSLEFAFAKCQKGKNEGPDKLCQLPGWLCKMTRQWHVWRHPVICTAWKRPVSPFLENISLFRYRFFNKTVSVTVLLGNSQKIHKALVFLSILQKKKNKTKLFPNSAQCLKCAKLEK